MAAQKVLTDRLKDFALFEDIAADDEKVKQVAAILKPKTIKAGEYVFQQGDHGEELFILMSFSCSTPW